VHGKGLQGVSGGDNRGVVRGWLQPVKLPELFFIGAHRAAHWLTDQHHQLFQVKDGVVVAADDHPCGTVLTRIAWS